VVLILCNGRNVILDVPVTELEFKLHYLPDNCHSNSTAEIKITYRNYSTQATTLRKADHRNACIDIKKSTSLTQNSHSKSALTRHVTQNFV